MIHTIGWNIQLNMMLVFVTHAAFLAHRMVASVVGQSQPLLLLALKIGNVQQAKMAF